MLHLPVFEGCQCIAIDVAASSEIAGCEKVPNV